MHQTDGGFIKPVIFGGLDGILTSFAIVAAAAGGNMPVPVVIVLGFSNILADALAMGVGEFLSSKAENEWILRERAREKWEMENYPEGEIREMIDIYEGRGMTREDATTVIETMAKYTEFFVDVMMSEELSLRVPQEDHKIESMKEGVVMFLSFATFGSLPILGYVLIPALYPSLGENVLFVAACVVTGMVLFGLGCLKSMFRCVLFFLIQSHMLLSLQIASCYSRRWRASASHWLVCGLETLLLGGVCATVAFTVGQFVDGLIADS
jgi:VIT1/CCC1 family predicted Fe2+/Mn2+ transporter